MQTDLVEFCHQHGIEVMSYMPFGAGNLVDHPKIAPIAAKLGKTTAQVILRLASFLSSMNLGYLKAGKSLQMALAT